MVRHIDHIAELVGAQHVSLGLDFVVDALQMESFYYANKDMMYPKGYPAPPWQYWPPERIEELVDALLQRGYSDDDIRGVLGGNFLRVATEVWH